jgi:hypothetical protein
VIPPATGNSFFSQKLALRRAKIFYYLPRPPSGGTRARVEASLLLAQPTLRYPLHHPLLYIFSLLERVLKTFVPKRNEMTTFINFSLRYNRIRLLFIPLHPLLIFNTSILNHKSYFNILKTNLFISVNF